MKTFVSTLNKLSISTADGIKDFYPLYLVPDELTELVASVRGIEDAGELFDVDAVRTYSARIEASLEEIKLIREAVASMRDDVIAQFESIAALQDNLGVLLKEVKASHAEIEKDMEEAAEISQKAMTVKLNGEAEANAFKEAVAGTKEEITGTMESLSQRITNEMTEAVNRIEETERQATANITTVKDGAVSTLVATEANCLDAEKKAKAWASNPEGVLVENGLYSAYHYAKLAEFNHTTGIPGGGSIEGGGDKGEGAEGGDGNHGDNQSGQEGKEAR